MLPLLVGFRRSLFLVPIWGLITPCPASGIHPVVPEFWTDLRSTGRGLGLFASKKIGHTRQLLMQHDHKHSSTFGHHERRDIGSSVFLHDQQHGIIDMTQPMGVSGPRALISARVLTIASCAVSYCTRPFRLTSSSSSCTIISSSLSLAWTFTLVMWLMAGC